MSGFVANERSSLLRSDDETFYGTASRGGGRWPPIVWFILKVSGIFYHCKVVDERKCISCEKKYYENLRRRCAATTVGNGRTERRSRKLEEFDLTSCYETNWCDNIAKLYEEGTSKTCVPCQSLWWDCHGDVTKYTEEIIGLKYWNHPGSWFVSVAILFTVSSLLVYEGIKIELKYFAIPDRTLNLLSYIAFYSPLVVFPCMNVYAKVKSALSLKGPGIWATTLNPRYIVQRLQFLDLDVNGVPAKRFLVICLVWPVFAATYRAYIKLALKGQTGLPEELSIVTVAVAEFTWGCYMFQIFLIRLSFQNHFKLLLKLLQRFEGQTELCQQVITRVMVDFKCFRQCVAVYMSVMIPACVLGVATSTSWYYRVNSKDDHSEKYQDWLFEQKNVNFMIWSDVAMFFTLGPLAVGGFDASYIWEDFQVNVIFLKRDEQRKFWDEIIRFMRQDKEDVPLISLTTVLTIVGLYITVEFGKQAIDF